MTVGQHPQQPGGVPQPFTFADLFAGIGGFHAALTAAGGQPWFASEIDPLAVKVYERNWGMRPSGDIVQLTEPDVLVPAVDVLAAGFPCQPFSKSGFQRGLDETRGTLFFNICRILDAHEEPPPVLLLENVRNLAGPRQRDTWETIVKNLRNLGYRVSDTPTVLSPHLLPPHLGGRPQVRERVFIPAVYVGKKQARSKVNLAAEPIATSRAVYGWDPKDWDLDKHLLLADGGTDELTRYDLDDDETAAIEVWNNFLRGLGDAALPGFPIWADAFRYPAVYDPDPQVTPKWKQNFLDRNAALYRYNSRMIDRWRGGDSPEDAPNLTGLVGSWRKLEWQAGQPGMGSARDLWRTVMHFRPSGIRAKRPDYLPALVAITQTSIIGPRRRRITPREAARLQGLPDWFEFEWLGKGDGDAYLRQPDPASYKQLGNGVNVGAAFYVLRQHVLSDPVAAVLADTAPHLLDAVRAAPENPDVALAVPPTRKHGPTGLAVDLTAYDAPAAVV